VGALQIFEIWMFLKQARTACYWPALPAARLAETFTALEAHRMIRLNTSENTIVPQNGCG